MKKSFLVWFITIVAYSIPIVVGLAMTGNWNVLWGFVPMVFSLLVYFVLRNDASIPSDEIKQEINAALAALVFGLVIVIILRVFANPWVLWLTVIQFLVTWVVCVTEIEN